MLAANFIMLLVIPALWVGEPGLGPELGFLCSVQLPADSHPGRQLMMAQALGSLSSACSLSAFQINKHLKISENNLIHIRIKTYFTNFMEMD